MIYLKYRFDDWETMRNAIEQPCDIAVLGDTSLLGASLAEGDPLPEPEGLTVVDIIWNGDEPEAFAPFRVWPEPSGHHSFAGMEALYENEYYNR